MARLAAHLPHARVRLAPAPRGGVGELGDERLDLRVQLAELLAVEVQRVEQLAVDVELGLVPGAVADAHRAPSRASRAGAASSRSERSCSPPIPYMICSEPSPARPPAALVMNETNSSASSEQAPM